MLFSSSDESQCFTQVENTFICALRFQGQGEDGTFYQSHIFAKQFTG